jgi:hypothetical protein
MEIAVSFSEQTVSLDELLERIIGSSSEQKGHLFLRGFTFQYHWFDDYFQRFVLRCFGDEEDIVDEKGSGEKKKECNRKRKRSQRTIENVGKCYQVRTFQKAFCCFSGYTKFPRFLSTLLKENAFHDYKNCKYYSVTKISNKQGTDRL